MQAEIRRSQKGMGIIMETDIRETEMKEEIREMAGAAENEGEQPGKPEETMADYSKELEASFREIHEGDILTGTVIAVDEGAATLDLNYYASGVIRAADMSRDPSYSIMAEVHVGDTIQATVVKKDDGAGNIMLSRVQAAETLGWDKLRAYLEEKTVLSVKISETVGKGAITFLEGIRGFIPISQLSLDHVEDTAEYKGKTLEVRVITAEQEKQRLVLSAKEVLREKQAEEISRKISMIAPGTVMEGRVESLMPYGAFVSLGGGMSGLIHISQISQKRIKTPSEVLKEGETVKVKVLNTDNHKISLSMKALDEEMVDTGTAADMENYTSRETLGTSLGSLLSGLKLD